MRIVESWLREWVDPDLDTEALAQELTMAGHEVDGLEHEGAALDGVARGQCHALWDLFLRRLLLGANLGGEPERRQYLEQHRILQHLA